MSLEQSFGGIATLVHLLPDAAFLKDGNGRWRGLNRAGRLLLGLEAGQVQGRCDRELAESLPGRAGFFRLLMDHDAEVWLRRQATRVEARVAVGTGERDLEVTMVPLFGSLGRPVGMLCTVRDITQRVRTASALRASERRFRDIFQMNAIAIWEEDMSALKFEVDRLKATGITDLRRHFTEHPEFLTRCAGLVRVLDVNEACVRLHQARSREELLGSLARVLSPRSLHCFGEALIALMNGEREYACETVCRTVQGEELQVLMMITVPEYGKFDLVLVSMIDITARKRTEEALKQSEAGLAEAQRIARMGTWERCLVTGETRWSDEVFRLFGFEPSAFLPSFERFMALVHPADREQVQGALAHAFAGEPYTVEYRITREGATAVLYEFARVMRDEAGRPLRLIGTVQDITARKQSEALKLRFGRILDRSSNEIFITDAATLRFIQVNQWAQRNLGYSAEELSDMTPLDIVPSLTPQSLTAQVEALKAGAESFIFETEYRRKDGSLYPVEVRLHYYPDEEPPIYVAFCQEISERKAVERIKAEFLATVSHELRTPLTALRGALTLLKSGVGRERCDDLLDIAQKNSERLLLLINDLLDLQTLESKNMEFRFAEHDLMELVEHAVAINSSYAAPFKVRLCIVERLPGARVQVDGDRLIQVLTNLLSNAAKFSPEGGEVEVRVTREGEWARVRVSDQGDGIPPEFVPRIFEKFAQADASSSRRRGGTGLGLSISREIIRALGGRISFDNRPGQGASFYFDLPLLGG